MLSERAALVAAILADPDDDTIRLMGADWFAEQGGEANVARAEFIRIQIRRARLAPEDDEHSELQARELRLLKKYALIWCGSHFVFKKVRFRRGFIEGVHLHLQHYLHHRRQMLALEPVRDLRLTGWHRAPADLLQRVAACEELRYIETLRIHHQGPHKSPRSDLMILLESPHWHRLRALHGTAVEFDANARRRFERLGFLRHVEELHLPTLGIYPHNPGEWFSDGGAEFAAQWQCLRSFVMPMYASNALFRRITELSWWKQLTSLWLAIPYSVEPLAIINERPPDGLQELHFSGDYGAGEFRLSTHLQPFLERLAQGPLRSLSLQGVPLTPNSLAGLLQSDNGGRLEELSLAGCSLTAEHGDILARSPGVENIRYLTLGGVRNSTLWAAKALFASRLFHSLIHLHLEYMPFGQEGAFAFANANEWGRLRSLELSALGLEETGLRALLASENLRRLNWLSVGEGQTTLDFSPDLMRAITELPYLAHLQLGACRFSPASKTILAKCDRIAWQWLSSDDDGDIQGWRASMAPELTLPLDTALESEVKRR